MPPKGKKKSGEIFEWFSVSYSTLKSWGFLIMLIALASAAVFGLRFLTQSVEQQQQEQKALETRPARLVETEGDVRIKQVNQNDWTDAQRVRVLNVGDVISTGPGAHCKLIYFDGTSALINENTLYVVSESDVNPITSAHNIRGDLTSGEVRMTTPEKSAPQTSVKLATEEAEAALGARTDATGRRDPQQTTSEFFVWEGKADVMDRKDRRSVTLSSNQGVAVSSLGGKPTVVQVPLAPRVLEPPDLELVLVDKLPSDVVLRWAAVPGIRQYRLRVSDQPTLARALQNQVVDSTSFRLPALSAGTYYWQVLSIDANGVESAGLRSWKFLLSSPKTQRYGRPIRLEVEKLIRMGDIYELVGKTDPGVRLTVNGKGIEMTADGAFKGFTDPVGSASSLEVVARDVAGNIVSKRFPIQ